MVTAGKKAHTAPWASTALQPRTPAVARHLIRSTLLQLSGIALQDTADQTLGARLLGKQLLLIHSPFLALLHYSQLCPPPVTGHIWEKLPIHTFQYRKTTVSYQS